MPEATDDGERGRREEEGMPLLSFRYMPSVDGREEVLRESGMAGDCGRFMGWGVMRREAKKSLALSKPLSSVKPWVWLWPWMEWWVLKSSWPLRMWTSCCWLSSVVFVIPFAWPCALLFAAATFCALHALPAANRLVGPRCRDTYWNVHSAPRLWHCLHGEMPSHFTLRIRQMSQALRMRVCRALLALDLDVPLLALLLELSMLLLLPDCCVSIGGSPSAVVGSAVEADVLRFLATGREERWAVRDEVKEEVGCGEEAR